MYILICVDCVQVTDSIVPTFIITFNGLHSCTARYHGNACAERLFQIHIESYIEHFPLKQWYVILGNFKREIFSIAIWNYYPALM